MFKVRCIDDRVANNQRKRLLRIGKIYNAKQSKNKKDCYTIDLELNIPHVRSIRDFKKDRFEIIKETKKPMSKLNAHAAMIEGHCISHSLFDEKEYLYYDRSSRCIKDEKGNDFEDGWKERSGDSWEKGWFIWEEVKQVQSVNL